MNTRPDPVRWAQIEAILDQVLARDPQEWPALLDEHCAGDSELRIELESLLRCAEPARQFLDAPPATAAAALLNEEDSVAPGLYEGRRVGAYRIVRQLGRGGMSYVFLAERADGGYSHHVALKILRPGLDTEIDQARFRAERQILATLNHPNIARLLDGGATDDGRPYLVMEHVDGIAIDAYAEQRNLGVRERLNLFRTVCRTTEYAHRNLVVHRDLKPSNIFVDGDGAVKLLDFGLAKLLEPGRTDSTTTRRWMTPEYAAPEQIRGEAVTTLTDVYQLGAVLYELLAGAPPFPDTGDSLHSLEESVLHNEPEPPSEVAARNGRTAIARETRGDLDAIVLKALHKAPEDRFDSVAALDRDLEAWLSGHPVQARRGSAWYRVRRLVRRRRIETVAVAGVSLSLIAAVAVSLSAARRAGVERDRAETASYESEAVSNFLLRLFEASDPAETQGDTLTAAQLVQRAALRAQRMSGPPAARARMLEVTAQLYRGLGNPREAVALLERAVELRRQGIPADDPALARTLRQLSQALVGVFQAGAADSVLQQALALQERSLELDHPELAVTLRQRASVAVALGDIRRAEVYARQALATAERVLGPSDSAVASSRQLLGSVLRRQGRLDEAEREYRSAWKEYERIFGADDPVVAGAMLHVAYLNQARGRLAEADSIIRRAIEIRRRAFGDAHPLVAWAISDLASTFALRGDLDSAVATDRETMAILRRAYGSTHPALASVLQQLGQYLHQAGQLAEAEASYREAIAIRRRLFGGETDVGAAAEMDLAMLLADRGDYRTAESLLRDALQRQRRAHGATHANVAAVLAKLGSLHTRTGDYALADSLLQEARKILERQTGPQDPELRRVYGFLAELETARRRPAEAARYRAIANGR